MTRPFLTHLDMRAHARALSRLRTESPGQFWRMLFDSRRNRK